MTGRTAFTNPANPSIYPKNLTANAAAGTCVRAKAEHKELIAHFEIFAEVE
jgi:hypothetical protein